MNDKIKIFKKVISENKSFLITTHRGPDGDAIGSSLAMYHFLKNQDKDVNIITPNSFPKFLNWLPDSEKIIEYEKNTSFSDKLILNVEVTIMLDFNDLSRIEPLSNSISNSNSFKVLIDHHQDPDKDICNLCFSYPKISSTCELLFTILNNSNFKINESIANCLYTGIVTDTGSFKYSCTTEKTHKVASNLISKGVDSNKVNNLLFNNNSSDRIKLLGYCLSSKLKIYNKKSAIISLDQKELNKFNFEKGDTEGIINYALSIKEVIFAVFVVEKDDLVKISFRSQGQVKVNEIAKKYFGGGGHLNAAGAKSDFNLKQTIKKIEEIIKTEITKNYKL